MGRPPWGTGRGSGEQRVSGGTRGMRALRDPSIVETAVEEGNDG